MENTTKPSRTHSPKPTPNFHHGNKAPNESSSFSWGENTSSTTKETQDSTPTTSSFSMNSSKPAEPAISPIVTKSSKDLTLNLIRDFSSTTHEEMNSILQDAAKSSIPTQKKSDLTHKALPRVKEKPETFLPEIKVLYPSETIGVSSSNPPSCHLSLSEISKAHEDLVQILDETWNDVYAQREKTIEYIAKNVLKLDKIRSCVKNFVDKYERNPYVFFFLEKIKNQNDKHPSKSKACLYLMHIGKNLQLENQALCDLVTLGVLYDLGKALINKELWEKQGQLSTMELNIMREHPRLGKELLEHADPSQQKLIQAIYEHHQSQTNSQGGYPARSVDTPISLYGQILRLVDVFVGVTSKRTYSKQICTDAEALEQCNSFVKKDCGEALFNFFASVMGRAPLPASIINVNKEGHTEKALVVESSPNDDSIKVVLLPTNTPLEEINCVKASFENQSDSLLIAEIQPQQAIEDPENPERILELLDPKRPKAHFLELFSSNVFGGS